MKTMKDFAAQQLSKKQMNQVLGGTVAVACSIYDQNGKLIPVQKVVRAETLQEARNTMSQEIGNNNARFCRVWTE